MSIESSLVIGKNPYTKGVAMGFDPQKLRATGARRLLLSLVAAQGLRQVTAFGARLTILYNDEWFQKTKESPGPEQEERITIATANIMSTQRCIANNTPPET